MNTYDPNDSGVIDQMVSAIYETETFNHHAHGYAMQVVKHYFHFTSDEWYNEWIATEEFRHGKYPTYPFAPIPENTMRVFEKMYDLYWHARGEWFNTMIANINQQNLREQHRMMYQHTLATNQSWEEYSKAARRPENRITHLMTDEED